MRLLLDHRKQYRVNHWKIAYNFFEKFMNAGKGDRGFKIRFVEIPEKCAIELQANSEYDLKLMERAFKDAKIIKHEIPFEINKVVKMREGRRDGRDFN